MSALTTCPHNMGCMSSSECQGLCLSNRTPTPSNDHMRPLWAFQNAYKMTQNFPTFHKTYRVSQWFCNPVPSLADIFTTIHINHLHFFCWHALFPKKKKKKNGICNGLLKKYGWNVKKNWHCRHDQSNHSAIETGWTRATNRRSIHLSFWNQNTSILLYSCSWHSAKNAKLCKTGVYELRNLRRFDGKTSQSTSSFFLLFKPSTKLFWAPHHNLWITLATTLTRKMNSANLMCYWVCYWMLLVCLTYMLNLSVLPEKCRR